MTEYLIRPNDTDSFLKVDAETLSGALQEYGALPTDGPGDYRYKIGQAELAIAYEEPGLQVWFEGDTEQQSCDEIVEAIAESLVKDNPTGTYVVPL